MFKNNIGKRIKALATILFILGVAIPTCKIMNSLLTSGRFWYVLYGLIGKYILYVFAVWVGALLLAGLGDIIDSLAVIADNTTNNKAQTVAEIKDAIAHKNDRGPAFEKDNTDRITHDDPVPPKPLKYDEVIKRHAGGAPDGQTGDQTQ